MWYWFCFSVDSNSKFASKRWNIDEHSFTGGSDPQVKENLQDSPLFQKIPGPEFGLTFVLIMDTDQMACPINDGAAYVVTKKML